jgi:hypothetical protein
MEYIQARHETELASRDEMTRRADVRGQVVENSLAEKEESLDTAEARCANLQTELVDLKGRYNELVVSGRPWIYLPTNLDRSLQGRAR